MELFVCLVFVNLFVAVVCISVNMSMYLSAPFRSYLGFVYLFVCVCLSIHLSVLNFCFFAARCFKVWRIRSDTFYIKYRLGVTNEHASPHIDLKSDVGCPRGPERLLHSKER